MRLIDIIATAGSNMLRSKVRTFLTISAIFIGALTLTLTNGIGSGISSYVDRQLGNLGAENVLIVSAAPSAEDMAPAVEEGPQKYDPERNVQATPEGVPGPPSTGVITEKDLEKVKRVRGIVKVEAQKTTNVTYIQGATGDKYQISASRDLEGARYDLAAGRGVDLASKQYEIMLPPEYPKVLGYNDAAGAIGKTVTLASTSASGEIREFQATIVGVINKGIISSDGGAINSSLTDALYAHETKGLPQKLQGQFQLATATFAAGTSEDEITRIKNDLRTAGFEAMTLKDTIGIFKSVINGIVGVLNGFAVIALLAASFGIINTLFMSVQERTKEIGLMKAMGMRSGRIFLLFSFEAALIGFWGSLLGILAAIGIGQVANRIVADGIFKDLPGFELLTFPILSLLAIVGLIMLIAFLAGTLPARKAARQNPIDALRYE